MPKLQLGRIGTCSRIAPIGRHLNYNHPLTHKLVWCAAPCVGNPQEMVSKTPGLYMTGGGNRGTFSAKTRIGQAAGSDNSAGYGVHWPYSSNLERIIRNFTFVFWINKTTDVFSYVWTKNYDGSTTFAVSLNIEYSALNNTFDCRYLDSGGSTGPNYKAQGPANMYTGGSDGLKCIAIRRTGATVDFFLNGVNKGNDTFGVNNDIDWNTREDVTLFSRSNWSPGDGSEGHIPLFQLFAGALPTGDIISLYSDPFQLFDDDIPVVTPTILTTGTTGLFPFFMHSLRQ